MIEIYYTGAAKASGEQKVPSKSLGGFISKSIMPNDSFNNLFGEISQLTREKKPRTIRVIAIKNAAATALTNLKVFTSCGTGSVVSFKLGYQDPAVNLNECGDLCGEKLPNENAIPHKVTLTDNEGEPNALVLPTPFDTGSYLFLYITRQIEEGIQSYTQEDLEEQEETPLETSETAELIFTYD